MKSKEITKQIKVGCLGTLMVLLSLVQGQAAGEGVPKITEQPKSKTVEEGQSVTLSVSAEAPKPQVALEMVWIEPGTFTMGSPTGELGRWDDETQHAVTLTKGYWMGKYEVTQAQYQAVMGSNPSYFKGDNLPVECVTWYDASEFCKKLTERERAAGRLPEGYEYTLPTEAQWEYACRAGTTTALNSGKNLTDMYECPNMSEVGWYWYNWGESQCATHTVGQKKPNAWGLYDMHGNVWEWCEDWYGSYSGTATNPSGPSTGSRRVMRGGGWDYYAPYCRSAIRGSNDPIFGSNFDGFRAALSLVQ